MFLSTTIKLKLEVLFSIVYTFNDSSFQFIYWFRWKEVKALPAANRIVKHFAKNGVPMALASNSLREYIYAKISRHKG
jgi:FMN phosphatase YigB (HAD superfamily)